MDAPRTTRIDVGDTLPGLLFEVGGPLAVPEGQPEGRGLVLFLLRAFT